MTADRCHVGCASAPITLYEGCPTSENRKFESITFALILFRLQFEESIRINSEITRSRHIKAHCVTYARNEM